MGYECSICRDARVYGDRKTVRSHIREVYGIRGPQYTPLRAKMPSEITPAMRRV